ncbi:MAG: DpnD/PcfM family protein [Oscillospiraceae bacterium]
MKTYEVTITETLQKTVAVEANSREEAEKAG